MVDVAIIGAGVTGTALLYVLSRYTDLEHLAILEKYPLAGQVNSASWMNSQTLHFGDIETNYGPEKARAVSVAAARVARYVERAGRGDLHRRFRKMVLGVGEAECALLRRRRERLSGVFPRLRLIERAELAGLEPRVVDGRPAGTELAALLSEDGYAVDFGRLCGAFLADARATGKPIRELFGAAVRAVERIPGGWRIRAGGEVGARLVIVAAGAYSLRFARGLGYGTHLGVLPVAGDFYVAPRVLDGKVYTVQDDRLPFAAVHGDPDLNDPSVTRFGPTARVLPVLERGDWRSALDWLRLGALDPAFALALLRIASREAVRGFALKSALQALPVLGRRLFLQEARKIVPGLEPGDLRPAPAPGGIRPQLVDKRAGELFMGEAQIEGEGILFDVTPSPGATVCLGNAEGDARWAVARLGRRFDEAAWAQAFPTPPLVEGG